MPSKRAFACAIASTALSIATSATAMPDKPYSDWSDAEKSQLADELKAKSSSDCASYVQEAQQGSMRATYEAAACLYGTYYLGTPADYPNRDTYKQQFYENAQKARALGSTAPIVEQGQ